MPNLKELKNRITSTKSTQKITSAMKMVAASKLRRAQEQAEASRPYAERMERMLESLSGRLEELGAEKTNMPKLLSGSGDDKVQLLLVVTSDRGLCAGFNSYIGREAKRIIAANEEAGRTTKVICIGRKGRDLLKQLYGNLILESYEDIARPRLTYAVAERIGAKILAMYEGGEFDVCTVLYNKFKSVIAQVVTAQQLIPLAPPAKSEDEDMIGEQETVQVEFEPEMEKLLADLLPRNFTFQLYRALLESGASEQGARMTAMDNATRNAGDMINRLTLNYNRTRQAYITKELIEIISGAEAL